jgi:hypothetical protein
MQTLLLPAQVDRIFKWPRGRAARFAKANKIAHVELPDGEIRFVEAEIERLLNHSVREPATAGEAVANVA